MSATSDTELKELGRAAAMQVAGRDAFGDVLVEQGVDFTDRPIYRFVFRIDQDRARYRPGLVRTRLVQTLRDALIARGDEHLPAVQILDAEDWAKRTHARPA